MKKRKFLLFSLLLATNLYITSCKKPYSCKCTISYYDDDGVFLYDEAGESKTIKTKSQAQAANTCMSYDQENEYTTTNCLIK